jgi:cell division protein FtsI (penicillin-binding protein 3)
LRSADLRRLRRRLHAVRLGGLAVFGLLAVRAGHLALVDTRGAQRGEAQTGTAHRLAPHRGLVVDRHGAELAVSLGAPSVYATPSRLASREDAARRLAAALGLSPATVRERLASSRHFAFVARWVSPEQARRVRELDLTGVGVVEEPRRVYPHHGLAAALLGFANIDGVGVRGVERQEDAWLRGTPLAVPAERTGSGRLLFPPGVDPSARLGGDVALTLDAVLQAEAERALEDALRRTGACAGLVVTLAARSGEILAVAERPGFDPNRFREVRYERTRSRALLDAVEPGSTLKAFLVAAALDAGAIGPRQPIDCGGGSFRVPGRTIRDRHPFRTLDPAGVLRVSSNVGATRIALALGPRAHYEALRRFGFGAPTGSGFPEESSGLLRAPESWRPIDHAAVAFGQGVSVTALQLAAATAALANDGVWQAPRLVAAHRRAGAEGERGGWVAVEPGPRRRAVEPVTAREVLRMLRGVVSPEGTGQLAALRDVPVAGKTGTAQKLDGGRYADDRYLAWFVGVVPADEPRLAIVVMLDEPAGDDHTGGGVAAPLFATVAAAQLRRLGIVTEPERLAVRVAARAADPPRPEAAGSLRPTRADPPRPALRGPAPRVATAGSRVLVPDFSGLTPEEARRLSEGHRLRVEVVGSGRAVSQEPDPGTILAAAARVRVHFAPRGG